VKDLPDGPYEHPRFTGEKIHPSVYWRHFKHQNTRTPYEPKALKGWKPQNADSVKYYGKGDDMSKPPFREKHGYKWVRNRRSRTDKNEVMEIMEFEVGNFPPKIVINEAGEKEIRTGGIEQRLLEQADNETKNAWNERKMTWRKPLELN
jgi:hypothetical protein